MKHSPMVILRKIWRHFRNLVLAAIVALASMAIWPPERAPFVFSKPLHRLEWKAYDSMFVWRGIQPEKLDPRIAILGYDRNSEAALKQVWPPARRVHAQVIRNLKDAGARLIVYDLLFTTPSNPEDDRALDEALKYAQNVVLACRIDRNAVRRQINLEAPYYSDELGIDFEAGAKIGFSEIPTEEDGVIRSMVPAMRFFDDWMPSLATRAFLEMHAPEAMPKVTPKGVDLDVLFVPNTGSPKWDGLYEVAIPTARVNFRGGMNAFDATVTFEEVYENKPAIQRLKDKIVFVGVSGLDLAKQRNDTYTTAYTSLNSEVAGGVVHTGPIPGVIVQAHMLNSLLTSSFIEPAPEWMRFVATFGFSFIGIGLARRYLNWRGPVFFMLALLGFVSIAIALFSFNSIHLPWAGPSVFLVLTAGLVVWNERKGLKRKWSGYVSPDVLEQILRFEEGESASKRYAATIVFGDVRGFTSFSDKHEPELVIRLLNMHFERLTKIIYEEKGTIDKFLGDGILVVFGAPMRGPDAAGRAVRASLRMKQVSLEPLIADGQTYQLDTGFGITTGEFVAGHVGSRRRHDFSVIGDVVNVAARLQGVTGEPDVIIDEATYREVAERVVAEPLGEVELKGKPLPVQCYRVLSLSDSDKART